MKPEDVKPGMKFRVIENNACGRSPGWRGNLLQPGEIITAVDYGPDYYPVVGGLSVVWYLVLGDFRCCMYLADLELIAEPVECTCTRMTIYAKGCQCGYLKALRKKSR